VGITISPSSGLNDAEDMKVGRVKLEVGQFQPPFGGDLGLRHSSEFSLEMGDLKAEV
jgi:hypothetical protein